MGMLIEGRWVEEDRRVVDGAFVRPRSAFGGQIGEETVRAIAEEPGRFHLVASLSCPWSHRVALIRALKGLEALVPLHVAGGPRTQGYRLAAPSRTWPVPGSDRRVGHLHELYALADPRHTGRATVPVLWDARERTIVSNESAHILRALGRVPTPRRPDWTLRPARLAEEIDRLCERVQAGLSNAVYRAGRARRQDAYEEAVEEVFATLGLLEERLARSRFLHGDAARGDRPSALADAGALRRGLPRPLQVLAPAPARAPQPLGPRARPPRLAGRGGDPRPGCDPRRLLRRGSRREPARRRGRRARHRLGRAARPRPARRAARVAPRRRTQRTGRARDAPDRDGRVSAAPATAPFAAAITPGPNVPVVMAAATRARWRAVAAATKASRPARSGWRWHSWFSLGAVAGGSKCLPNGLRHVGRLLPACLGLRLIANGRRVATV